MNLMLSISSPLYYKVSDKTATMKYEELISSYRLRGVIVERWIIISSET